VNDLGSPNHLQAALGGHYTIERELGGGGMSRTFVARDDTLGRRVVIKVLPPDLAATVSHERFRREIMVSASLQHPNIVGVLTAGEVDTLPYFTMPFVDGESLRMRMQRSGPMPVGQVVSILRDVARALAYAHESGVVHRDVKPDNVLLAAGAAVVADFGVAKALSSARETKTPEHGGTVTSAGTALGTPAYMAPEQAAGDPHADARADIYAFGAMAYEMLTGAPPFSGRPPAQLMAAQITETPVHIAMVRKDIPRALAGLIMQCLEKDPANRPQTASEIASALEDPAMVSGAFASTPSMPAVRTRRVPVTVLAVAVVVLIAAAAFGVGLAGPRFFGAAPPAAPVVVADPRSIAVLPLVNLSSDSADAYLARGITDELTNALARLPNFRVASRTAAAAAQSRGTGPEEIGAELNVAYLFEGTFQRQGDRVRVIARLVSVTDGFTAWSQVYDRRSADLFKVQDEIARAVADALRDEIKGLAGGQAPG
jgi:TolB-like protein